MSLRRIQMLIRVTEKTRTTINQLKRVLSAEQHRDVTQSELVDMAVAEFAASKGIDLGPKKENA